MNGFVTEHHQPRAGPAPFRNSRTETETARAQDDLRPVLLTKKAGRSKIREEKRGRPEGRAAERGIHMAISLVKLPTKKYGLTLRVCKGHFATNHSHINYYIDVTAQKFRLSEAKAVAQELAASYKYNSAVDTVLCLDGTEVIGACMASDMQASGCFTSNEHGSLYVVTPEHSTGSQLIFRENTLPMVAGKHVLILMASVTTGYTADSAMQAVQYYGGKVVGIASIFATIKECNGLPVTHIFDTSDLADYASWDARSCPLCRQGVKLDALVNSYGYSNL